MLATCGGERLRNRTTRTGSARQEGADHEHFDSDRPRQRDRAIEAQSLQRILGNPMADAPLPRIPLRQEKEALATSPFEAALDPEGDRGPRPRVSRGCDARLDGVAMTQVPEATLDGTGGYGRHATQTETGVCDGKGSQAARQQERLAARWLQTDAESTPHQPDRARSRG